MAKKRASKRKSTTDTAAENDESYEESNIVENGEPGSSSSTPGKKKRSAATKAAQKTSKNDEEEEDSEENYEVEQILDVNFKKGGQREFLIRWKNYTSEHDTWEPEGNLSCHELITKFLEGQEDTDTAAGNDENNEESPSTSNPVAGSSKSTSSKKKRSAATKTTQKKETKNKTKSDDEEEEEENYEVEKILDVNKSKNGKRKFLIRWKNYSSEHDSWEPEENLSCRELITKFLATQKETDADLENDDESQSDGTEDDAAGSSKSTASKKKKSVTSKAAQKKGAPKSKAKSDTEEDTAEEDYEVEKILDVNYKKNGKRLFLIRWKNYSSKHDSWEPEENLSCDEIIKKFLEVQEEREKQPRKELRGHPKSVTRYAVPTGRKSKRTAGSRKVYTEDEDEDDD